MTTLVKILIIAAITFILAYPFIRGKGKFAKLFPASGLRYYAPDNRKNFVFVILASLAFIAVILLFRFFNDLIVFVQNLPIVGSFFVNILKKFDPPLNFIIFTLRVVIVNCIIIYAYVIIKALLKKIFFDTIFGIRKKNKKDKKKKNKKDDKDSDNNENPTPEEDESENEADDSETESDSKKARIPRFIHTIITDTDDKESDKKDKSDKNEDDDKTKKEKKKHYGRFASFILGLFFEGEQFEYAKSWVIRVRLILQCFITLVEIVYALFLVIVLIPMPFSFPDKMYTFLIESLKIADWYIYPVISLIFLQEVCNTIDTLTPSPNGVPESEEEEETKEEDPLQARLRKLLNELKKHFDEEHHLRYYPEAVGEQIPDYEPSSRTYRSALNYIKKYMELTSGKVVQSYMKCLDASFNDNHVYFASSFYSELGEYLIAYTYIRLLAGSRMIIVTSDAEELSTLRSFVSERLIKLTGVDATYSWRIHTSSERLDQADVLIASPDDFKDGSLVKQNPAFFEEVSNAIFLDADRQITLNSYLCPVMATQLKKATGNRIRFIFLTQYLYKGFSTRSLPKFFCVEPVLAFSSAKENESVSYVLWNRESKSHRIYNKDGQKTTCLETMIADLAHSHNIDGIRVITESDLDPAERKLLETNSVEINKFYRSAVDVNYMIYSDERCNLAASIYACTRFRGRKKSVVHILSKPYLLREYFMSKAATENFVNRSSFIQPRVLEHVDQHKLSLLRVFCEVSTEAGLSLSEFEKQVKGVISIGIERGDIISSAFCKKMLEEKKPSELKTAELAAYLVAALYDSDIYHNKAEFDACVAKSAGHRAKEYYLIIDPEKHDSYTTHKEKFIRFNREHDIFNRLFACNERVELRLNDELIGFLDTFPLRTHLEYIAGQSIRYNNCEYEIEHISEDGKVVYLRSGNVKIRHCLDTVHLRRYELDSITPIEKRTGILNNTKLTLQEIRVTECEAAFTGETYGFYGLTSDKQTLDFYHKDGLDGNPHVSSPHRREIIDGRVLKVELCTRMECTDGMRLLMAAVFNEFVRTIFPKAYHFISIVPQLSEALPFDSTNEPASEIERIKTLYPYLVHPSDEFLETDSSRMTFFFINDCHEDVGAFQWFYDLSGRYMQELLSNIYSYLNWLKIRPKYSHYIYFGGEALPECYDLEGCCKLLDGYNLRLSNIGEEDIETASEAEDENTTDRCAFCHREMETGRFSLFDKSRYICASCFDTVDDPKRLDKLLLEMRDYIKQNYSHVSPGASSAALDGVYELSADQVLSEYNYYVNTTDRLILVEQDNPVDNVRVSLLRGLIELWQADNMCICDYSKAQLYYEELKYLRSINKDESASWIYQALPEDVRKAIDEISAFTGLDVSREPQPAETAESSAENETENTTENTTENAEDTTKSDKKEDDSPEKESTPAKTSFDFIISKRTKRTSDDFDEVDDKDGASDKLYNPNKVPRFWKRYLKGENIDDGKEEDTSKAIEKDDKEGEEGNESKDGDQNTKEAPVSTKEEDKKKPKNKRWLFGKRLTPGEKIVPYEDDEAKYEKIRVYNEIARHAYNYSEGPIVSNSLTIDEFLNIILYVQCDYPELFWLKCACSQRGNEFYLSFRCKDASGKLDVKQINKKRSELKRAAKKFTRGITRRTDPYEALTTIYRRLILCTDYDGIGLNMGVGKDERADDQLRSLHSALVLHKVVCAGYAVALQYLLQSVGIVCGYVISENDATGSSCHAFNILKIGKFCYYIDATWGDSSNTDNKHSQTNNWIQYDYFCVPYNEFRHARPDDVCMHTPSAEYYPKLENFNYTNHEYYRYRNAYLHIYNEGEITRIIADAAEEYDEKEMGDFTVAIRFSSGSAASIACSKLMANGTLARLIENAKETLSKKSHKELLERPRFVYTPTETGVLKIRFESPDK